MVEKLTAEINSIVSLREIVVTEEVRRSFIQRLSEGQLTRDENPETHFCVYFAAFDPKTDRVFIGHHKKSGFWLFNGGHIDEGETTRVTLRREIGEEWGEGIKMQEDSLARPELLTITQIDNPKVKCKTHYDIWYFVWVNEATFNPEKGKLDKEFYETRWVTLDEARKLVIDPATLIAINYLEK